MTEPFPSRAPSLILRFGAMPVGDEPLLICGMFTASHVRTAERLAESLSRLKLPHALFEVPAVHRSISPKGVEDPVYTKANLIWHVLEIAKRPVLYLDCDCVVRRAPDLIFQLAAGGYDFAILNWLAQDHNDAYVPIVIAPAPGKPAAGIRFFRHSHHIDLVAQDQLICSGAAQFWARTPASAALLGGWFSTIVSHRRVADDQCLDFTFNNRVGGWQDGLRPYWLPKSYARYAFWIFDEPIIDHPEFPYAGTDWAELKDSAGRLRLYPERATVRKAAPFVPRDCLLDTQTGHILKLEDQKVSSVGQVTRKLWLPKPGKD